MVSKKLKNFLDESKIDYKELSHKEAFTSQQVAQAQHISGEKLVKSVVLKHGDDFALLAIPATHRVEISKLKELFPKEEVRLATEYEIGSLFPDCQIGAMPPFGNLYKIETLADDSLKSTKEIVFQSGDHTSTIKMDYKEWDRLVSPKHGDFSLKA